MSQSLSQVRGRVGPAATLYSGRPRVARSRSDMNTMLSFLFAITLFTASVLCGVCYGVAIREYGQRHELGHADKSPYCSTVIREAHQFFIIGVVTYLLGIAVLFQVFWHS